MKKVFKKENVMPLVVLGLICLLVAALLGIVNHFTSQEIEKQMLIKANAGKIEVLPGLDITTMVETVPEAGKYPSEVKKISKFDVGYVIETEVKGNAAGMVVLVGIDNDGKVTGVKVLANAETPSFWSMVSGVVTGNDGKYSGQTFDTLAPEIVSGATNSSSGVYNAVKASLDAFVIANDGEVELEPEYTPPKSQREDSELLTLAGELVAGSEGFTEAEFDEQTKYLVKVLKENSGKGYVAYVVVMSENYAGQVESETLIHIGNTGKIQGVKKLVCKISDALYGYVPPSSEEVDAFYDRLPENNSESIDNVELVTNATNTSTNVRSSIKEALEVVTALIRADIPTPEADLFALAEQLAGTALDLENVTPENTDYARRIYRDKNGKGYFAYTVVINERYQRIETETLVHVGIDGKIKGIKKIIWKTSDAGWGYEPPAEELVNSFYDSLVGADLAKLEELNKIEAGANPDGILVTQATSTSKGLLTALIEGVGYIVELLKTDLPTPEEELLEIAAGMVGEGASFTDVTPTDNIYVKKIYRENSGKGYIAYTVVINERYQRVETETLIYVGMDGKIKDIERLTWKTSDAGWGYVPPAEELVNSFYDSLVGADLAKLEELNKIEVNANPDGLLVTQATSTSKGLLTALTEALKSVNELIVKNTKPECVKPDYTARAFGIAIVAALVVVFAAAIIVNKKRRGGKNG